MKFLRRPFGKGKKVSLFTLGTMRVNSAESMYAVLKDAFLLGINHIETAPTYGSTQKFLGDALIKLNLEGISPNNGYVITSKLLPGISFCEGKEQIIGTLTELGLSKIDNLALHGLNLCEHLDWYLRGDGSKIFRWAQDQNLITQCGFTSHGSRSLINEAIKSREFDFCSLHIHLLDQKNLALAKLALKLGMGVMAISPADKGGHLHTPSETLTKDCSPIPPLKLAYRFLISEGISTLTLGTNDPNQLLIAKELISENGPLTNTEKSSIERLNNECRRRLKETFCGQCRECLPCPKDVPIPEILRLRNLTLGHGLKSFAKERYNLIGKAGHWWEQFNAASCAECGDCLPRCPNNLNIPKLLKETHSELIDKPRRRLWG